MRKDNTWLCNLLNHRYYVIENQNITVYTKHFSTFEFHCHEHGSKKVNVNLFAELYTKTKKEGGEKRVNVKVFLVMVDGFLFRLPLCSKVTLYISASN